MNGLFQRIRQAAAGSLLAVYRSVHLMRARWLLSGVSASQKVLSSRVLKFSSLLILLIIVVASVGAMLVRGQKERAAALYFTDSGGVETVLLDQKNGERRNVWIFSLLSLKDIGSSVKNELGYGSIMTRSAEGTFFRGSFSFAQYGQVPIGVEIRAIKFFDGAGKENRPLRVAFCGQKPSGADTMEVALLAPKTPCTVELLFDAAPGIGPYSLRVSYQEKLLQKQAVE